MRCARRAHRAHRTPIAVIHQSIVYLQIYSQVNFIPCLFSFKCEWKRKRCLCVSSCVCLCECVRVVCLCLSFYASLGMIWMIRNKIHYHYNGVSERLTRIKQKVPFHFFSQSSNTLSRQNIAFRYMWKNVNKIVIWKRIHSLVHSPVRTPARVRVSLPLITRSRL